ncbi:hypothetical protein ES703_107808 [subsurface metagenome]
MEEQKPPEAITRLAEATKDLELISNALLTELAGSAKWIEIILYILRIIKWLIEKINPQDAATELEIEQNQKQIDAMVAGIAKLAEQKMREPIKPEDPKVG